MVLGASNWIKLNVGGQPFLTTLETILSCPDSVLSKMFDPESGFEPAHKENGVYFIDANPTYFGIILDWMRYRQIIAGSEINLNAVAKIADYYGLVDLVEEIKKSQNPPAPSQILGKWLKSSDIPREREVDAMRMTLLHPTELQTEIVQTMCSRFLSISLEVEDGKHLSLDLEGRSAVWVQTTTGRIPPEAIAVEGEGGKRMFIGRKLWLEDGTALKVFEYVLGEMTIPMHAYISVGYVNDKGIWSIDFSKSVENIADHESRARDAEFKKWESLDRRECTSSEFEILCMF